MKVLIVGYGRAGKRHARIARDLGLRVVVADPMQRDEIVHYSYLSQALEHEWGRLAFVVIATPPDQHLTDLEMCLRAGLPVFCEKPLCAIGQIEQARAISADAPVMVNFCYRFHPSLLHLRERKQHGEYWSLNARQHRVLPEWGGLLDHCSHDLQIMDWLAGPIQIEMAEHYKRNNLELWQIRGQAKDGKPFFIMEQVFAKPRPRAVHFSSPTHWTMIPRSEQMYQNAWRAFLQAYHGEGDWTPGLDVGIRIQELLEEVAAKEVGE